ncbi:hypothetical protein EDD86DRAFT_198613 [Gorgonomyces haynaldii]|nr:hypothetical protein EDD86DRAFT_198613 [Gorgonomyces haynaldii]
MRSIMGMSGQRKVFKDKALDILRIQEQMMEKPDFNPRVSSETTRSYIQSLDRDWLNPLLPFIPARVKHFHLGCAVSHPQTGSCHLAMMKQWLTCMKQVAPLYLVTNAAPILLGKLRQLYAHKHHSKKDPKNHHSLRRFLVSYVRSCIMMSTYIACFFYFGCLLRRIGDYKTNMGLAGLLAGPAVLLERDGRITELNQYSVGNAVEMIKARQQIRSFGTWYLPVLFGYLGYVKRNHSGLLQGTLKIGLQILM